MQVEHNDVFATLLQIARGHAATCSMYSGALSTSRTLQRSICKHFWSV